MSAAGFAPPTPQPTPDSEPYWEGLKSHRLLLQRCPDCGRVRHYPRPVCDACYSMNVEWIEATGRGVLYSWTVAHHAFHPAFRDGLPYVLVTVDLAEGVRLQAPLRGVEPAALRVGLPLRITYEARDDGWVLPAFVRDDAARA